MFVKLLKSFLQDNMMDFIFAVRDPQEWHKENMALNPKHYSALRFGGHHFIANVQENWGAKIYFNTLIPTHEGVSQLQNIICHRIRHLYNLCNYTTLRDNSGK